MIRISKYTPFINSLEYTRIVSPSNTLSTVTFILVPSGGTVVTSTDFLFEGLGVPLSLFEGVDVLLDVDAVFTGASDLDFILSSKPSLFLTMSL